MTFDDYVMQLNRDDVKEGMQDQNISFQEAVDCAHYVMCRKCFERYINAKHIKMIFYGDYKNKGETK